MSKKGTPLFLRNEFTLPVSVVLGGIIGGLLYSIGKNTGEYDGMVWAYNQLKEAIADSIEKSERSDENSVD